MQYNAPRYRYTIADRFFVRWGSAGSRFGMTRYEAGKLRRQLAGRLAEIGEHDAAIAELERVHEFFERMGARPALEKTVGQFAELGAEPPD